MYCTTAQLEDRVTAGILAAYVPEVGADRTRVLEGYARRASARVDAMLSVRYAVPAAQSDLLSDICQSLALWQIAADRGGFAAEIPPSFQKPYDEAMSLLKGLASGDIALEGGAGANGATAGLAVQSPPTRIAPDSPGMEWF